jgi:D-glycero-alpha-D-manno-heptose-7-phosphate kinase
VKASASTLQELDRKLMLFFTGFSRFSFDVQQSLEAAIPNKTSELQTMKGFVDEAESILVSGRDLDRFGLLLDQSWQIKRKLTSRVSTSVIDDIYSAALKAGALGGKLLGSGSGGFLLFYVDDDQQDDVRSSLHGLMEVPFRFEHLGTHVLYCVPETYTREN